MKINKKVGSKYRFIVLAGERVAQLQRGAQARVDRPEKKKMTDIAMEELEDEKLVFTRSDNMSDNPDAPGEDAE